MTIKTISLTEKRAAVTAIRSVVRPDAELVVVHSQVGAFGPMHDPVDDLLGALLEAIPDGATLAMPVFTFGFISSGQFDLIEDSSETGVLTESFRCREEVLRTRHPIYSFAMKGPLAGRLAELQGDTCWGAGTLFEVMEDINAEIVMLGSNWEQCTLFHRVEQSADVPYRYAKRFAGHANFGAGDVPIETEMFVRRLDRPVENNFRALSDGLRTADRIRTAALGRGIVEACSAQDILVVGRELVKTDPLVLLADAKAYRAEDARWRVALMSSANLETFSDYFQAEAEVWVRDGVSVYVPPYDQYRQELLAPKSELKDFDPEWIFFLERSQDILGPLLDDPAGFDTDDIEKMTEDRVCHYIEAIHLARQQMAARIFVTSFDVPEYSPFAMADPKLAQGHAKVIGHANQLLIQNLTDFVDIRIIDFERISAAFGRGSASDRKYWYIGRIPFGRAFACYLSRRLVGAMLAMKGGTARVIVTDLDDTLWGGTVGEDGKDAVAIGTDYPGNTFADFQRALKALSRRGIALAICSRNTEQTALSVFEDRSEMVLSADDFVARRINWNNKADNIREIAAELALGTGSVCFLDDDPYQRALVRQQLPDVFVPELPSDPAERTAFLLDLPCLELLDLTHEDSKRVERYKSRAKIMTARDSTDSLEEFYSSLEMELSFEPLTGGNRARILQLIAKTNQFNTTTKRYGEAELENLIANGHTVWAVGLADRFSGAEIIGVLIILWQESESEIDSFLLSCRVLGRSVETGILGWVADQTRRRKLPFVRATIVETPRNQPARRVYQDNDFKAAGDGVFVLDVSNSPLSVPTWFKVRETSE